MSLRMGQLLSCCRRSTASRPPPDNPPGKRVSAADQDVEAGLFQQQPAAQAASTGRHALVLVDGDGSIVSPSTLERAMTTLALTLTAMSLVPQLLYCRSRVRRAESSLGLRERAEEGASAQRQGPPDGAHGYEPTRLGQSLAPGRGDSQSVRLSFRCRSSAERLS